MTEKNFKNSAFTLVELLVVIAIAAILTILSVISFSKVLNSGTLTTTAQSVIGLLDQARQTAITRQLYVEVRFYELPLPSDSATSGTPVVFRAMQTFLVSDSGYTQLSKVLFFPTPIIIQTTPDLAHSSLLDPSKDVASSPSSLSIRTPGSWGTVSPPIDVAPSLPNYNTNYAAITVRFTPRGSLSLDDSLQWFLTLISSNDKIIANNLPANYATIQIDGFTGKTTNYRP